MTRCTCRHPEYYDELTPQGIVDLFALPCVRQTVLRMAAREPLHGRYWKDRLYLSACPHNRALLTREHTPTPRVAVALQRM